MPKLFGKDVPTWMVGAAVLVGVVVLYTTFAPSDDSAPKAPSKPIAKKKDANDVYLPIDHTVRFASFTEPVSNSFKPLVSKLPAGVGQAGPTGISAAWAGGEANWSYTGYLVVNSAPQGLLEKSDTGEGDYVSVGDHWKHSLISKITPDTMTIVADDGPHVVKLGDGSEQKEKGNVVAVAPVNPAGALQGAIGAQNGYAQQGNGINPADITAVPDPSAFPQTGQGNGRGRGGRRGRGGGGGFGGGGFGGG